MDVYTERFQEILSESPSWSVPIGLRDFRHPVYVPIRSNLVVCSRYIDNLLAAMLTGALAKRSDGELNVVVLGNQLSLGLPSELKCHPSVVSVPVSGAHRSVQREKIVLGLEEEISERRATLDRCGVRSVSDLSRSRADDLQQFPTPRTLVLAVFIENADAGQVLTDARAAQFTLRLQHAITSILTSDGSLDVYMWLFGRTPPDDGILNLINRRIAFRVFAKKHSEALLDGDHRAALLGTAAHGGPTSGQHGYIVDDVNEGFPYRFEQFTATTSVGSPTSGAAQSGDREWKRRWETLFVEELSVDQLVSLWRATGDTSSNSMFPIGVLEPNESNAKRVYTMNSITGDLTPHDVIAICGQDNKKNTQALCSIAMAARAAQPGSYILYIGNTFDMDTGISLNACADKIIDIDDNDALVQAYVRKVRTASGAVAVQVARKDAGRVVIVAHLGSARTDAELGILLEQAQAIVVGGQVALDFEVAARAQSMADVADFREQTLIAEQSRSSARAPVVAPGRTIGATSRLLYDVLGHVYDWLGFDTVGDAVFRDLVIARIVEPTSKVDASRVLGDLGAQLVSYKTIDRHVRKCCRSFESDHSCSSKVTTCRRLAV